MQESFDWLKPSPLWDENSADISESSFFRPALLEYATDDFVEAFLADAAAIAPSPLGDRMLAADSGTTAKLYQPAHGRFYLLCATLSCRQPGLPDRVVCLRERERVFYVLRRVSGSSEFAWIPQDAGSGWHPIKGDRRAVVEGEEQMPMFDALTGNDRSLKYAYIATASRQSGGGDLSAVPSEILGEAPPEDLRLFELESRILGAIRPETGSSIFEEADAINGQRLSIYTLLDLFEYFQRYLPILANRLIGNGEGSLTDGESALLTFLASSAALSFSAPYSLRTLLQTIAPKLDVLDALGEEPLPSPFDASHFNLAGRTLDKGDWIERVTAALDAVDLQEAREKPQVALPQVLPGADEQYVIRCVYHRPQCDLVTDWVSHPTAPFVLAPLYDPDAPARQINIALPSDISLSSLRKYQKGATFVMSSALRQKLKQVPLVNITGDDADVSGIDLGYICSFSIPIITICAFILLMILVIVLNFVFWWLPFLKICFPIPKPAE